MAGVHGCLEESGESPSVLEVRFRFGNGSAVSKVVDSSRGLGSGDRA